jgi:hypothetical protein
MINIEHIRDNVRVLSDDIQFLEDALKRLDPDSVEADSKDRILNVKWRLLSEQRSLLGRA